jgi:hypothetical protein
VSQRDLENRLENIIIHLNSGNLQYQAAAFTALYDLLGKQRIPLEFENKIIKFIKNELNDVDSSIRTDCFKIAALLGKFKFRLIDDFFPQLFHEISLKNRFRSKIIMDLIGSYINSTNITIKDAVKEIILNAHNWFSESYLIPIIMQFYNDSTQNGYFFIENYKKEIEIGIKLYPSEYQDIIELLKSKLDEYNTYKEQERVKKDEKDRIIEVERANRQLERENIMEEINKKKSILQGDNHEQNQLIDDENKNKIKNKNKLTPNQNIGEVNKNNDNESDNELKSESDKENRFVSFTSLGLKRKSHEE